jgi:LysR family hydrogen peroxide-inducible transcriptional activator
MSAPDVSALSLTELRYLVAVDDTRHFGRAARRCHVTQPTLSAGIKKLEATLGVTLFERSKRSVRATPTGSEVARRARRVLDEVDALARLAARDAAPLSGSLRVGFIPTLGPYLLPWLLPALGAAFPALRLQLREAMTGELIDALREHQLDAAFLALPAQVASLAEIPLFDEPFWVLAPATHRLAKRKRVSEGDLAGERILLLTEGHCLRDQALEICRRAEAQEADDGTDFRATSLETLRQMVRAGIGTTLVPALAARSAPDEGASPRAVLRPFREPQPVRRIGLVHRRSYPKPEELARLAEEVRAALPEGVTPTK